MIDAKNIVFSYRDKKVLRGVDFTAHKGEVISLIGPNGSGKSTLLRCICGILSIQSGEINIMEQSIKKLPLRELSKRVAFLPQFHEKMNGVSVWELVSMGRAPYHTSGWVNTKEDKEKVQWSIDYMELADFAHKDVENLSGGEKQRAWIAMILAQDTPIILLDEPVTYMDIRYQCQLISIVKALKQEFNKTIVAVFHDINHAVEVSDRIYLMKDGEMFDCGENEMVINEENIRQVYGVHAHVCRPHKCCRNVVIPTGISEEHPH